MNSQRLLLLAGDRLSAHRWRAGQVSVEAGFACDSEGLQAFSHYLEQHRRSTFRLLALQAEDSFQRESLPRVRGRDRDALLARKLSQYFHAAPLSLALPLGRERDGRRYQQFLLAAVTGGQPLEPWLQLLGAADIRLAGLYTPSLLAGSIAAGAMPIYQLLTLSCGGLHQIVFANGQPRLSRLTRLGSDGPQMVATESVKITRYLIAQRVIEPDTALTTAVLVHPQQLAAFRRCCRDSGEVRFVFIDLLAEARRSGLKTLPADSFSETLFLHLMMRKPARAQFASAALRRNYRIARLRLALTGAGAAILAGSALFSAAHMLEYRRLNEGSEQLRRLTASDGRQYRTALRRLPPMPVGLGKLRAAVRRYDRLDQQTATLEPMYQRISRALDAVPGVDIERIDWTDDGPGDGKPSRPVAELMARLPVELASDPRAQLDAIGRFSAELRRDRFVAVQGLALPFETGSGHSLKGGEADSNPELRHDAPQFSLRIVSLR